jgi:peroxiredoxin
LNRNDEDLPMRWMMKGFKPTAIKSVTRHVLHNGLLVGLFLTVLFAIPAPVIASDIGAGLLKDFDGGLHSLNEYTGKGKWTIVMLWASDCSVCNAEAKHYVEFHTAHKDKDATMLGVSLDGWDKKREADKFIERHAVSFPNLIESPEKVAALYTYITGEPWIGTPTFLVYSPTGELLAAQVGAVSTDIIESFMEKQSAKQSVKQSTK